jgi:hypothetical protein
MPAPPGWDAIVAHAEEHNDTVCLSAMLWSHAGPGERMAQQSASFWSEAVRRHIPIPTPSPDPMGDALILYRAALEKALAARCEPCAACGRAPEGA